MEDWEVNTNSDEVKSEIKKSWKDLAVWTNSVCALVLPDCLWQWQGNFSEKATSLFLTDHGTEITLEINHMNPIWII